MRWLLLFAVGLAGLMCGQETSSAGMREKVRVRIVDSLPASPLPAKSAETTPPPEEAVLVLEPIVVTESRGVRELAKALADDRQRQEARRFTATQGGTIHRSERVEVGSWWSPDTGWQILKFKW